MPWQNNIELVVLGAAGITCIYHFILFIHTRDRYLLLYANYLLSLTAYLSFRQITHYDSFEYSTDKTAFILDYPIILYMLVSYVLFISKVLSINDNAFIIKFSVYAFYVVSGTLLLLHIYKIIFENQYYITRTFFATSKLVLLACAFLGLSGAFRLRKTIFIRTIILGGFVYATFSLFTVISVYYQIKFIALYQYQLYFVGCLLDILLFSSALGYRNYLINAQQIETQQSLKKAAEVNQQLIQEQHQLLQKKNERDELLLVMHNEVQQEVGAALSSIHIYADIALKNKEDIATAEKYLKNISHQSIKLMDDIGDIIWLANIDMLQVHETFITRVKNYGQEILAPENKICEYKINSFFHESILTKEFLKTNLFAVKSRMKEIAIDDHKTKLTIVFDCKKTRPEIVLID